MPFDSRSVPCRDITSRPRATTVAVDGDAAVVTNLPGEVARYTVRELSQLIDALAAARGELHRREA